LEEVLTELFTSGAAVVAELGVPVELTVFVKPVEFTEPVEAAELVSAPAVLVAGAVEPTVVVEPAVGLLVALEVIWLGAVKLLVAGPAELVVGLVALTGLRDELVSTVAAGWTAPAAPVEAVVPIVAAEPAVGPLALWGPSNELAELVDAAPAVLTGLLVPAEPVVVFAVPTVEPVEPEVGLVVPVVAAGDELDVLVAPVAFVTLPVEPVTLAVVPDVSVEPLVVAWLALVVPVVLVELAALVALVGVGADAVADVVVPIELLVEGWAALVGPVDAAVAPYRPGSCPSGAETALCPTATAFGSLEYARI
jgi:hypothetical protein